MNIAHETDDGCLVCRFTGSLTIWEAADTWHQILPLFESNDKMAIDLSQVGECDAAGIQILCQIWRTARDEGKTVSFDAISEPIFDAMQLAGMDSQFLSNKGKEV